MLRDWEHTSHRHVQACTGPGVTRDSYLLEAAMVDALRVVEDSLAKTQTNLYISNNCTQSSMRLFIFLPPAQPSKSEPKTNTSAINAVLRMRAGRPWKWNRGGGENVDLHGVKMRSYIAVLWGIGRHGVDLFAMSFRKSCFRMDFICFRRFF